MNARALIIGASGQVGKRLLGHLRGARVEAVGTAFSRPGALLALDVRDRQSVDDLFSRVKPTHVFLASALTNVDYCEDHPDEARALNVTAVEHVARASRRIGAKLLYVSTEYVFDGAAGPYDESAKPNPISVYGRTKWEGEEVALALPEAAIVRTTVVYDWDPDSKNFIMGLIGRLSSKTPMRVMNDQWSHPTLARDLASALWEIAAHDGRGVFHVVGSDYRHRFAFAQDAARIFGFDASLLQPVTTPELKQRAPRPLRAGLTTERARKLLVRDFVGVEAGLAAVKKDWEASLASVGQ